MIIIKNIITILNMSIIINVSECSRNNSLVYKDLNPNQKPLSKTDIDTSPNFKKIQHDNLLQTYVTDNSNKNFSKVQTTKDIEKSGNKLTIINDFCTKSVSQDDRKSEKNSVSVDINLNLNNSLISSGYGLNKEPKSKSVHENSYFNSNNSYKKQTVQTSTEKNICDEIELAQAEADKCIDRME